MLCLQRPKRLLQVPFSVYRLADLSKEEERIEPGKVNPTIRKIGNLKGEKMEKKDEKCQVFCHEACEGEECPKDPEDALVDLKKMSPEEIKGYLESLLRNRSWGS
jgi:hypothetical protein